MLLEGWLSSPSWWTLSLRASTHCVTFMVIQIKCLKVQKPLPFEVFIFQVPGVYPLNSCASCVFRWYCAICLIANVKVTWHLWSSQKFLQLLHTHLEQKQWFISSAWEYQRMAHNKTMKRILLYNHYLSEEGFLKYWNWNHLIYGVWNPQSFLPTAFTGPITP